MKNEYIPFLSEIVEVIKHTEIEYTFRMRYTGDVKQDSFLRYLCLNLVKRLFLSAALVRTL